MSKIKVIAGDFKKGDAILKSSVLEMESIDAKKYSRNVHLTSLEGIEIASEESVKKFGGTVGWGIAGGLILGPVGLLAGVLAGGRGKEVTFVAKLKDGRKFMATTDSKTYTKLKAGCF